jgi:membrane carboxypeptidase/penicillin-binding protein PbpC
VILIAREMGLDLPGDLTSQPGTLGSQSTAEVSLASLTTAYGVLANEGRWAGEQAGDASIAPISILQIVEWDSRVLPAASRQNRALVSAPLAYLMNDVLSDETERREAYGGADVLDLGRPASVVLDARTKGRDFWGVGYTRERAVGAWLGGEGTELPTGINPLNGAAPVWHALLQYATRDLPPQGWSIPAGVREIQVCDPSGLLPTQYCPRIVREVFIDGTEPTSYDSLYQPLRVNRETGKLATLFTPIDQVEERVYLVPPPAAAVWAQAAGIEKPPTEYDTVLAGESGSSVVNLTRPEMFGYVRGTVALRGAAHPREFEYYRLQYGQGLNPTRWVQIGADSRTAVASGALGEWDTDGLEGLYSVQLVVVYGEGQVSTDAVQVTVDNAPPRISLVLPEPGTHAVDAGESLVIEAEVADELGVRQVEFFVDGERIGSAKSAPYSLRWAPVAGEHTITARATDHAGNLGESRPVQIVITE